MTHLNLRSSDNPQQSSRREFLTAAAAGAAGFALTAGAGPLLAADTPQPAAGPGGGVGSGDKSATLRWGLIGTGNRGTWTHVRVLKSAPGSQLVALCDIDEQRLKGAENLAHQEEATRNGDAKGDAAKADTSKPQPVAAKLATYTDYQKLLANPDINAVVIATPNLMHREMFLAALQAGKHVLCEKPFGASPADAAAMKKAADTAKTVVMFGMQYRNNPRQQKLHELVASGQIGTPRYIVQNVSRGDWNRSPGIWQYADPKVNGGKPGNWRFSHAATGGTLNEFDCHYFDLIHWMTGALPERVSCDGGISVYKDGRDTWDHATVTLKYPGDVTAVHTLCLFGPGRNDLLVFGDEGSIETAEAGVIKVNSTFKRANGRSASKSQEVQLPERRPRSSDDATLRLYDDFLECVKTGKKQDASPGRAVAASRTCWLGELSAERKAEVRWDELA